MTPNYPKEASSAAITPQDDLLIPLAFAPTEIRKPTSNASWSYSFPLISFRKITAVVLELESLVPGGRLDALDIETTINGRTTAHRYETSEYSFGAPTQVGYVVDASSLKIDGSVDITILLRFEWSLLDAGVLIRTASLRSFNPQPSFGDGLKQVPLVAEWNSYDLGGIPPLTVSLNTMGFLGNASGSNSVYVNCLIEVMGVDSPWIELYFGTERLYYGDEASKWINSTIAPPNQNDVQIPLAIEYHPHRIDHRNKIVTIQLQLFAEFLNFTDQREAEREQILANMPKIPVIIANFLILNAVVIPLVYFRKKRIEERSLVRNVNISQKMK
ncbi:MAG: hypothetical protein ACFFGZ_09290 [Candidatus Thorarchaeota archaeon]